MRTNSVQMMPGDWKLWGSRGKRRGSSEEALGVWKRGKGSRGNEGEQHMGGEGKMNQDRARDSNQQGERQRKRG